RYGDGRKLSYKKQDGCEDHARLEIAAVRRPNVRPKIDNGCHQIAASCHCSKFCCWLLKITHGKPTKPPACFLSYRDFHLTTFASRTCPRPIRPITLRAPIFVESARVF